VETVISMNLKIARMAILLMVGLSGAVSFGSSASASDLWHVAGTPTVISQEVQFANAGANLVGTVYLPWSRFAAIRGILAPFVIAPVARAL
jgi:hypothetical protein